MEIKESKKAARRRLEVFPYDGSNHLINKYLTDDENWWIVNGSAGRRPIEAPNADAAIEAYLDRFYRDDLEESDELNDSERYSV